MPQKKSAYHIIIAKEHFPIEWPTYTFLDEDPGFDARVRGCTRHAHGQCATTGLPYQPAKGLGSQLERLRPRRIKEHTVAAARAAIKQMVVHLDGCASAEMCFNVLHNERGLSCHFLVDNDGTIYQTCDLVACAYHAAGLNETSIGVELCNRGDAKKFPHFYDDRKKGPLRDVVACEVNGNKYIAYEFTKEQYGAMEALGKALARHLPGIRLEYPQSSPGLPDWGTLDPAKLRGASGYIGHYHITNQKWDPGPFDFKRFIGKLAGRRTFPIGLHGKTKQEVPDPPDGDRAARAAYDATFEGYYDNNELEGRGGYYPVGPLDRAQLYHGGVHLRPAKDQPVLAPLPGKVVIARNGPIVDSEIGSTSFVLLAHSQKLGDVRLAFWSLYMHLAEERAGGDRPKFMAARSYTGNAEANRVTILDPPEPVQAGDVIGHAGVGPDGEPTLHWEIFTTSYHAVEALDRGRTWTSYSGAGQGRFCTVDAIVKQLDVKKKDRIVTAEELLEVYRGGDRFWSRTAVTNHPSEWADTPDWLTELFSEPGFVATPSRKRELARLVELQILPTLWWTREVAERTGLAEEARVFTYHPVTFLRWLNDLVGREAALRQATQADYDSANGTGQLDIDDRDGTSFVSDAELAEDAGGGLTIEDLLDGYGD